MTTCPSCHFLVSPDATTCSVCGAALPSPGAIGAFVAPGQAAGPDASPSLSFTAPPPAPTGRVAAPPPFPGQMRSGQMGPGQFAPGQSAPGQAPGGGPVPPFRAPAAAPTAPPQRTSTAKVLAIVGLLCLVPFLALVGIITLLGTTGGTELRAEELLWTPYDAPDGRYQVQMPGQVDEHTVEMPDVYGMSGTVESAVVENPNFVVTVARTPAVVPADASFETMPFSPTAAAQGIEEMGMADAELTSRTVVEGTGGAAMDMFFRGDVDGRDSVFLTRLVIGGEDLYELNVVGPIEDEADLRAMHDRLVSSFELG